MKITTNFNRQEFDCKDGTVVPNHLLSNVKQVCENLEVLRTYLKAPISITGSGYRTKQHNKRVGGASNSLHLTASAADINVKGYTPKQVYDAILFLISQGKMKEGGVGLYKGFVHYDVRGKKARW